MLNEYKFYKYKKPYYIEKEKKLTPFFCYKCICFHFYNLEFTNYKGKITCDCKYNKSSISLEKFLDYGLCLYSNEIKCIHCENKFLSDPKMDYSYCKECKSYICKYCINNKKHNSNNNYFTIGLNELWIICLEHNKKYKYCCSACNKNICEECCENHKKHKYILPLNNIDIKDKKYINKPKDTNENINKFALTYAKKKIRYLSVNKNDEEKKNSLLSIVNTTEKNLSKMKDTNYLIYLIVLKIYIIFFKYKLNNKMPYELENNLQCFYQ